jgi:hypothetical protein
MATTTSEPRPVVVPTWTELEGALGMSVQTFAEFGLPLARSVELLATREDLDEDEDASFIWPEPVSFEQIGQLTCWASRVRSYLNEIGEYMDRIEEWVPQLEGFTPEHSTEAFRARISQAERQDKNDG